MNRGFRSVGAVALGIVASLAAMNCSRRVPDVDLSTQQPRVVLLPEQRDLSEIRSAVIGALQTRGWVTEQEQEGEITARLSHKGATVRLLLQYSGEQVAIKGLLAEGAGRNYERWLANIEASIREGLVRKPAAPVAVEPSHAPPLQAATPPPTVAVFEATQRADVVKSALQRALAQHNWVIEQVEGNDSLVARLSHRKGLVRVRIAYDDSRATISYVESQDLDIDSAGRSQEYERWMRNLVDAIRSNTKG